MSAVSNTTHRINGNLIVSGNKATAEAPAAATTTTTQGKSFNHLHHPQQLHHSPAAASSIKFHAPPQQQQQTHQKRSLIPSVSLQQQQQQQAATNQVNQLQTVATIHQPSFHTKQHNLKTAVVDTGCSPQPLTEQNHTIRRSAYQPAHSIPPRYQPPPQHQSVAPQQSTGILKNLNSHRSTNGSKTAYTSYLTKTSDFNLNNIKYPQDIPQITSVFIPDSLKNPPSNTRYLQQRQQQQQQQQTNHQNQPHRSRQTNTQTTQDLGNFNNGNSLQQTANNQAVDNQHQQEMLKFVRKTDQDHPSPNASVTSSGTGGMPSSAGRLTAEQNRQLQSLINELRALKEQNQRLMDDNQELRDLCCFLDDDRQKGRKLAREWQRFGRYTASVMRQEVAAYQNKLRQLDDKQQELLTDNLELKELCLYLDEERAHIFANSLCGNCGAATQNILRDDGDGSSSSTNAEENITVLRNYERQLPDINLRSTLQDQTLQYVRSLERRIQQLEEERIHNNNNNNNGVETGASTNIMVSQSEKQHQPPNTTSVTSTNTHNQKHPQRSTALDDGGLVDPITGRPEAVVRALQVLEVREQLERDRLGNLTSHALDQMDDGEKALVREMCNVVWRKLEGSPNGPNAFE